MKLISLILALMFSFAALGQEITHDYILSQAFNICKNHQGFHFIVTKTKWYKNDKENRHPCNRKYVVSCQDEHKQVINDEGIYCFISKMQIDESLELLK